MGDTLNEYSGGLSFNQTDVSLPGNNVLPVSVGRRLVTGTRQATLANGLFGDWDLEIPHLRTIALEQWPDWYGGSWSVESGSVWNQNRCTQFTTPRSGSYVTGSGTTLGIHPTSWWGGHQLLVPGFGDQTLLSRAQGSTTNPIQPTDNGIYPVLTKQFWQISCLPSLVRGSGEGFLATAPDGTRYRFDHMVQRSYPPVKLRPTEIGRPRLEIWILPTLITDRFGNWVSYSYEGSDGWRIKSIKSIDGRSITFTYYDGVNRIKTVFDGTRTWSYAYDAAGALQTVTLPDTSQWQCNLADLERDPTFAPDRGCGTQSYYVWDNAIHQGVITHPSGAQGIFQLKMTEHGRAGVPGTLEGCEGLTKVNLVSRYFNNYALIAKSLSGPGMPPATWAYAYGGGCGSFDEEDIGDGTKVVSITDPESNFLYKTFGNRFGKTEGLLLKSEVRSGASTLRTSSYQYAAANRGPYPSIVGFNDPLSDSMGRIYTPEIGRVTYQQGATFARDVNQFDTKARPTQVGVYSSLGPARTETTIYEDNTKKWVLGQIGLHAVTGTRPEYHIQTNAYHPDTALRIAAYSFDRLVGTYSYNTDGTLATSSDALGHITSFSEYKLGIARKALYADGTSERATVDDLGLIRSVTDASGYTTTYGYDAMGRLSSKTPPVGGPDPWNATTLTFQSVSSPEYGLDSGHWRQTVATGNARTIRYFDALWRPVLTRTFDTAADGTSGSDVLRRFDIYNRTTFESYPTRGIVSVNNTPAGTKSYYDALGRLIKTEAASELGTLTTNVQYLDGFRKKVINARGQATVTTFQGFDKPEEAFVVGISAPEGLNVVIERDILGKPLSITRSGTSAGTGNVSATRRYVYDQYQRLCKTIEPETGATVQMLDAADNIVWRATGLALPSTTSCDTSGDE